MNYRCYLFALLALAHAAFASARRVLALAEGKHDNGNTIRIEKTVACSPARTYAMWSTDDGVRSSFAPASRIGREPGEEYSILFRPAADPQGLAHGTKRARILAASPGRFLAFEWITFAGDASLGRNAPPIAQSQLRNEWAPPTWVEIELLPIGGAGTRIVFRHYGFREGELWRASQAWFTRAWDHVLDALAATCAKGTLASR